MGEGIGIVGSGVAGLRLGLFLRGHDVPVDHLLPTGAPTRSRPGGCRTRSATTTTRWSASARSASTTGTPTRCGYVCHHHYVAGGQPLRFRGDFAHPSSVIDYRLYLPRLMEDFESRGGEIVIEQVAAEDVTGCPSATTSWSSRRAARP